MFDAETIREAARALTNMSSAKATIWKDPPELATPESPALFYDANKRDLWLAYAIARSSPLRFAVVRFTDVIDHRLSPINDEGIGKHPYYKAGLHGSFNELRESEETNYWTALRARGIGWSRSRTTRWM